MATENQQTMTNNQVENTTIPVDTTPEVVATLPVVNPSDLIQLNEGLERPITKISQIIIQDK